MTTEKDKTEEVTTTTPSADATGADATGTGGAIMRELPPNVHYSGYPTAPLSAFEEAGTGAQSGSEYSAVNEFLSQFGGESDKDRKKRERREAAQQIAYGLGDTARALGNLYFTTQYSPSQDIDKTSMSEANQQRLDRLRKEREQNRDRMTQYAFNIAKLKGDDDYRAWKKGQDELAEQRRVAADKYKKEHDEKALAYKKEKDEEERRLKEEERKRKAEETKLNQELREKQLREQERHNRSMESISASKGHGGGGSKTYKITVDGEELSIDTDKINDYNVSCVYELLPDRVRKQYDYDEKGNRQKLSKEQKMQIIASHANGDAKVKRELRALAGKKPRSGNF